MGTRSAGLDETAERLSADTRQWVGRHADYLGSPAAHAELPATPHVKALLQLALLCRYWSRLAPTDPSLVGPAAVVEHTWLRSDFPRLLTGDPRYARQFQLMYAALAPAGTATDAHRVALARLETDGFLSPRRKSPYLHLETRFYADLAGAGHRLASYPELYASSLLARAAARRVAEPDVCEVTHTVFYLSDFGLRDPGLTGGDLERAVHVVDRLTEHCVRQGAWDLVAKLVLAQHCLGVDPLSTSSGAAGIRLLARALSSDGAIPGKSVTEQAAANATPVTFFRRAYQATLGTTLAMLIVTGGRSTWLPAAGASAAAGGTR
ncbi:hypothetical protein AB0K86_26810 [Streptomyces clavifer]|uniref:DUF6895 family protein n=1 Tax=Streptomyces TaxID=1883 RepID=UPI0006F59223|nr:MULTISPECIES: hypothetical protein [unclassified Streptomyces]KQX80553.1 hypothetical protein ASD26_08860 [Streptomyces sp. Root1319]KQZ19671.1 hypothetical protein ASD51_28105 [Streptomyces sp. Root55]RPK83132.1 hypothetical protein EES45_07805 [Streptomyces sp. ADI97-07]